MSAPVILAVDDDASSRALLEAELRSRYDRDYRVVMLTEPGEALAMLQSLHDEGEPVAVVMAKLWMADMNGRDMLSEVKELHPRTKRAVLIPFGGWGDAETAATIRAGVASGCIDYYLVEPWKAPDEAFHRTLGEFLYEWARGFEGTPTEVTVFAPRGTPRGHELRNLLTRNGIPHVYVPSESGAPRVTFRNGAELVDPSNQELADAWGFETALTGSVEVDVAVVGAGPAGLAAAVYGSSEGLDTLVIEREAIGGQAGSSSMIRNYLGFARGLSGAELAQRAYQQAWVFGTRFLSMTDIVALEIGRERHTIRTGDGAEIRARAVVLAMGVTYMRLELPALEALLGRGVFYGASPAEAKQFEGASVFLVGAGNSAGQAALHLAKWARSVTLVVRGDSLAKSMSAYLINEIEAAKNISVRLRTRIVDGSGELSLESLTLHDDEVNTDDVVAADALFVLIGAHPHTSWLPDDIKRDKFGFIVTGTDLSHNKQLDEWVMARVPYGYETSVPGVFAVGDVRSRSMKRVASSVGEGSGAIKEIHGYFEKWELYDQSRRTL